MRVICQANITPKVVWDNSPLINKAKINLIKRCPKQINRILEFRPIQENRQKKIKMMRLIK